MSKRILYIQYTNPTAYPPLEHSSSLLAADDWCVRFIGTQSRGSSNELKFASQPGVELKLMDYCEPGIRQKLHFLRYVLWCLWVCLTFRPQIVYASDAWSYPIGYMLSFLPRVHVVMHEHDTPNCNGTLISRLIMGCRRRLARRAMLCVCPQEQRAANFERNLKPRKLQVVFNCPSGSERLSLDKKLENELGLWFHGSIVPTQLPLNVIDAMRLCDFPVRLSFSGYETIGHAGYVEELLSHAKQLGLGDRVHYLGAIPTREHMYQAASINHVGLALFSMNFREPMVGASNKPFDYLACGLALLVTDTPEWQKFFVDRGCGLACNSEDIQSIAQKLDVFWRRKGELQGFVANGQALLASDWNYEHQFKPVLQAMNAVAEQAC